MWYAADMIFFLNLLANKKILDLSELTAFADNEINVNQKLKLVSERVGNIMGKEENASYLHFFFSHNVLKRLFPQGH